MTPAYIHCRRLEAVMNIYIPVSNWNLPWATAANTPTTQTALWVFIEMVMLECLECSGIFTGHCAECEQYMVILHFSMYRVYIQASIWCRLESQPHHSVVCYILISLLLIFLHFTVYFGARKISRFRDFFVMHNHSINKPHSAHVWRI